MNNELAVVLPAYNEQDNLESLVENWQQYRMILKKEYNLNLKIFIINDGSKDNTGSIGEKLEYNYDNVTLLNHISNKGLGEAVKTGLSHIVKNCTACVFACIMDCDNTHDPKYILDMIIKEKETGADVTIASRYQKGSKVKGVSSFRLFTSEGARFVYSSILGVKNVRDYTCGYRLYKTEMLSKAFKRFGDSLISEKGFTCMAELLYKLYCCGAVFTEIPFELRYDFKKGASKMKVVKTALDSVKLAFKLKNIKMI